MMQDHIAARLWADHRESYRCEVEQAGQAGAQLLSAGLRWLTGGLLALSLAVLMLGLAAAPTVLA